MDLLRVVPEESNLDNDKRIIQNIPDTSDDLNSFNKNDNELQRTDNPGQSHEEEGAVPDGGELGLGTENGAFVRETGSDNDDSSKNCEYPGLSLKEVEPDSVDISSLQHTASPVSMNEDKETDTVECELELGVDNGAFEREHEMGINNVFWNVENPNPSPSEVDLSLERKRSWLYSHPASPGRKYAPSSEKLAEVSLDMEVPSPGDSGDRWPSLRYTERLSKFVDSNTSTLKKTAKENDWLLKNALRVIGLLLVIAYLIYACVQHIDEVWPVLGIAVFGVLAYAYSKLRDNLGGEIWERVGKPAAESSKRVWIHHRWPLLIFTIIGLAIAFFFLVRDNPGKIISAIGLLVFIFITYVFSKHRQHVEWTPVVWGLALQVIFGLIILRTNFGFAAFSWLGDLVQTVLSFSDKGADFLFGSDPCPGPFFAFRVLPVVLYFSAVIAVLYHLGVMKVAVSKIAWLMQYTMKTSAGESLNAAGNIFIGQTEAPLLIQPLLKDMTKSELHAVMTGGFATIAGSVLGAYVAFGISSSHLLSASVMSAPAALAISKLFYPETELSNTRRVDQVNLPKSEHRNVIEAASHGAYSAIPLVLNIAGNLVAFLALLALLDGTLGYLGALIDIPELNFMFICGYLFTPVAWLMGVDPKDCKIVAKLIGSKTFINELYAYEQLAELIRNRLNGIEPSISIRSEVIATYALCGFANIGSVGIQLGGLTAMAPSRKKDLAKISMRALVAGTVACFMTACVAGVLYDESTYDAGSFMMPSPCDPPIMSATEIPITTPGIATSGVMSTQNPMTSSALVTAIDSIHTTGTLSLPAHGVLTMHGAPANPTHNSSTMFSHGALTMSANGPPTHPTNGTPIMTAHGAHANPSHSAMATTNRDALTMPANGGHANPTHGATTMSAHSVHGNPTHGATTIPVHGAPADPTHGAPTIPVHGAHTNPTHGAPTIPVHGAHTNPTHGATAIPDHGALADPAHDATDAPEHPAHNPPAHG